MHYCSQEEEIGALRFLEGNKCTTVLRRRKQVLYCFQEKGSGALLFSGERNWCTTVLRRRELVHYCSQEKETSAYCF